MGMKVKPLWIVSFSHTIDMVDNWLDLQHNMYASSNYVDVYWLLPRTGREKCSAKPVRAFVPQFNGFSMTSCMFCQNPLTPEPFWLIKWVYLQLNHPGVVSGAGSEPDLFAWQPWGLKWPSPVSMMPKSAVVTARMFFMFEVVFCVLTSRWMGFSRRINGGEGICMYTHLKKKYIYI